MRDIHPQLVDYIRSRGKVYTPAIPPERVVRGKVGDCFDASAYNAARRGFRYVEGIAEDPRQRGTWVLHAWITDDGKHAYDPTWKMMIGDEEHPLNTLYIGIEMPIEIVARFMVKTGYKSILANAWRDPELAQQAAPGVPIIKGQDENDDKK